MNHNLQFILRHQP